MSQEPTTAEKIRLLPWSYLAGTLNTFFTQFTFFGSVFILFLSELGLSKTGIGFLLSLFPFFGLTALFTAPAVARFGYKRTYLVFWTLRKTVTAGLLLTPAVLARFGPQAGTLYVGLIVAGFAVCRAVGETGNYPWVQEYVPASVRGKFAAAENRIVTLASLVAVAVAGYVLEHSEGLTGFMLLITAGVVLGFASIWASSHIPGGAPQPAPRQARSTWLALLRPLADRDFRLYLFGASLIALGTGPIGTFLPLFMQEQVGLTDSQVVWLQTGGLVGGLASSFVWGWAADRYGSKPVMLTGVWLLAATPALWMLMPRHSEASLFAALAIAFVRGFIGLGWGIGSTRQLFVGLVPSEKKSEYMALHYAWMGAVGGLSQLAGGWVLDLARGVSGEFLGLVLDPYAVLFIGSTVLAVAAAGLLHGLHTDSRMGVREFTSMFFQGNPLLAAESLIRYSRARDEQAIIHVTERLGQAKSPLTVEELLEAMNDPRFNVRFEAIIAMARMPADSRVIEALGSVLTGPEPALAVIAAWALGRIRDDRARPFLHAALDSRYRSVQAHTARALGTLLDASAIERLLERFKHETDHGLRMAYASALGKLGVTEATAPLLAFLRETDDAHARLELALAVARLIGAEHHFIQLWRGTRGEAGTAFSQAVTGLRRRLERLNGEVAPLLTECADTFAHDDLDGGARLLSRLIAEIPLERLSPAGRQVLAECAARLAECKGSRPEYILLALHTLHAEEVA